MTAFRPQQSDHARCVRKKAYAGTLQIHVTNCAAKLHSHFHEARKIACNNLPNAVQAHVMELLLYAKQALPLIFIRLSRLTNSSLTNRRNPAIRSRNGGEPSHKSSGEMSPSLPHNFPAIAGRWKSQCRPFPHEQLARQLAIWHAIIPQRRCRSPRNRQCNIPQDGSSKFLYHVFNSDAQQL